MESGFKDNKIDSYLSIIIKSKSKSIKGLIPFFSFTCMYRPILVRHFPAVFKKGYEMPPVRYNLLYEGYSDNLMSKFGKMLQTQCFVDMTLMCNSHTLRVHKLVLAASSTYFQEVLQNQKGEPMVMLKIRFAILKSLVEFMYCGKTTCLEGDIEELVAAAKLLNIKGLSKINKEGLGITDQEVDTHVNLPPPVVISMPIHSGITQREPDQKPRILVKPGRTTDNAPQTPQRNDNVLFRIPIELKQCNGEPRKMTNGSYYNYTLKDNCIMPKLSKPKRGRPSSKVPYSSAVRWDDKTGRSILPRDSESRLSNTKINSFQNQEYKERMALHKAVESITDVTEINTNENYPQTSQSLPYINTDITTSNNYTELPSTSYNQENKKISNAMTQYVTALKDAGLPTDLPILFESGDGSYINVNEQVLLDMVQSSEIQYQVIEQPIDDPNKTKSIDDLSKTIGSNELIMMNCSTDNLYEDQKYSKHTTVSGLDAILPDNIDTTYIEEPNYVNQPKQNYTLDNNDFTCCIDSDMQCFDNSNNELKKYYEEQNLGDDNIMTQLCGTSSMNIERASIKNIHSFASSNVDLAKTDCYELLQMNNNNFKNPIDCLMNNECDGAVADTSPISVGFDETSKNYKLNENIVQDKQHGDVENLIDECCIFNTHFDKGTVDYNKVDKIYEDQTKGSNEVAILHELKNATLTNPREEFCNENLEKMGEKIQNALCEFDFMEEESELSQQLKKVKKNKTKDIEISAEMTEGIPFAVGLLPLNEIQNIDGRESNKRKCDIDYLSDIDDEFLKHKDKIYKKL